KFMFYNPVCLYRGPATAHLWENRANAWREEYTWPEFGPSEQMYWAGEYAGEIDDIHELYRGQVINYPWLIGPERPRKGRGDKPYGTRKELEENVRIVYYHGDYKPHNQGESWITEHWV
ncbi:hypothetical protein N9937_01695, partial [bacterium]|nr:hypothetical protein [bacterium]